MVWDVNGNILKGKNNIEWKCELDGIGKNFVGVWLFYKYVIVNEKMLVINYGWNLGVNS